MAKKPKLKTVQLYKRWRNGSYALRGGALVAPLVPASIVTGINWDEWFNKSSVSLPFGFASLMVAVIIAVVSIINSGEVFKKTEVALLVIAGIFACVGTANLFLAELIYQVGLMWLYTSAGLFASFALILTDKKAVRPVMEQYKKLIDENYLVKSSQKRKLREDQAKMDAKKVIW